MPEQIPLQFAFNADQTFDSFFPAGNQELLDQLSACVQQTGERQIYIWGDAGQGKSHLLQASCQSARENGLSAFYLALGAQLPPPAVLQGIENVHLVCLDDIDRIAGLPEWEEAVFNFYNNQRTEGHALIVSASTSPSTLPVRLPDLKTRLSWGLALKLQTMSESQKINALSSRARSLGFDLPPQVGQYLLNHYARDLPSLWALLNRIDHETLAAKQKLSIPFLKRILAQPSRDDEFKTDQSAD